MSIKINPALEPITLEDLAALARQACFAAGSKHADRDYQIDLIRRQSAAGTACVFDEREFLDD